jgi:hypothetical protein
LGGGAARIFMNICIAGSHVGQMLFAGNKYLLLKRITVLLASLYFLMFSLLLVSLLLVVSLVFLLFLLLLSSLQLLA